MPLDLLDSPAGVLGDERFGIVRGLFQSRKGAGVGRIPERHAYVAKEPAAFGASQRGPGESLLETGLVERKQLEKRYRELLRAEIAATVSSPDEVEDEIQNLMAVMTR